MNRLVTIVLLALCILIPHGVHAQTDVSSSTEATSTIQEEHRNSIEETQRKIEEVRQGVLEKRNELFSTFQDRREEAEQIKEENNIEKNDTPLLNRAEALEARNARREALQTRKDAFITARQERRAHMADHVQEKIMNYKERVSAQYYAILDRFQHHANVLDQHITQLKARGIDTSTAELALTDAHEALATAQIEIETAFAGLDALTVSDTPRELLEEAQDILREAKANLKTAHTSLIAVVEALKEARTETITNTTN